MKAHRSASGGKGTLIQAIGISRGGLNSKLHALTDGEGQPLRFLLTGGQIADCRAADVLLDDLRRAPSCSRTRPMTASRSAT